MKWDDGSQGAYSLKAIDRDGCVSNKQMRLRHDDCEMEGRTHYAESSESDDDEAMSSNTDPTETEVAETLDHERYAKGNEYYIFCDTQKRTSIMDKLGKWWNVLKLIKLQAPKITVPYSNGVISKM